MADALIDARWEPDGQVVVTRLSGTIDESDVDQWRDALDAVVMDIPDGTEIALLSDLWGYEPASIDVHRRVREVIPRRLAAMGFRTSLVDAVAGRLEIATAPRITCVKVAHVHHDHVKMSTYERAHGSAAERFFGDRPRAFDWLIFD